MWLGSKHSPSLILSIYEFYEICFGLAEHCTSNDGQKYFSGSVVSGINLSVPVLVQVLFKVVDLFMCAILHECCASANEYVVTDSMHT